MDIERKVNEVPGNELKEWLKKIFIQYSLDVGQNLKEEELHNLQIRAYYQLTEQYSQWTIESVQNALKLSLNNEESRIAKLTVKNFFIWLRIAKDKFASNEISDREFEHFKEVNRDYTHDPIICLKLSSAILWKLANIGEGKAYPKEQWDSFPVKLVADYIEECKNPHDILK